MAATVTKLADNNTEVVFHVVNSNVGTTAVTDEVVVDVSTLNGADSNTRLRINSIEWSVSIPVMLEFDYSTDQLIWALRNEGSISFKPDGLLPRNSSGTGDLVITHAGVGGGTYSILIRGSKEQL